MDDYSGRGGGRYVRGGGRFDPSRGGRGRGRFEPSRGRGRGRLDPSRGGRGRGRGRFISTEPTVDSALSTPRGSLSTPRSYSESAERPILQEYDRIMTSADSGGRGALDPAQRSMIRHEDLGRGSYGGRGRGSDDNSDSGRSSFDGRGRFIRGGQGRGRSLDGRGYYNAEGRGGRFQDGGGRGGYRRSESGSFYNRAEANNERNFSRPESSGNKNIHENISTGHDDGFQSGRQEPVGMDMNRSDPNAFSSLPNRQEESNHEEICFLEANPSDSNSKESFPEHDQDRLPVRNRQESTTLHPTDIHQQHRSSEMSRKESTPSHLHEFISESARPDLNSKSHQQDRFPDNNRPVPIASHHDRFPENTRELDGNSMSHQQDRFPEHPRQHPDAFHHQDRFLESVREPDSNTTSHQNLLRTQIREDTSLAHRQDRCTDKNRSSESSVAYHQQDSFPEIPMRDDRCYNEHDGHDRGDRFHDTDAPVDVRFVPDNRENSLVEQTDRHDNDRVPSDRFNTDNRYSGRGAPDRFNDDVNCRFDNEVGRGHSDRFTSNSDRFEDDQSASSGGRGRGYQGRGRGRFGGGRFGDDQGRGRFSDIHGGRFTRDDTGGRFSRDSSGGGRFIREDSGGRFNEIASIASHDGGRFGERGGRSFRGGRGRIPYGPDRGRGRSDFRGGRGGGRDDSRGFAGRGSHFGGTTYDRNESFDGGENDQQITSPMSPRSIYGGRGRGFNDQPTSPRGGRDHVDGRWHFSNDDRPYRNDSFDDSRKRPFESKQMFDYNDDKRPRDDYSDIGYDRREYSRQQETNFHQDLQQAPPQQQPQAQQQHHSQQPGEWSQRTNFPDPRDRLDPRERQDPRDKTDPRDRQDPRDRPEEAPHVPERNTNWTGAVDVVRSRSFAQPNNHTSSSPSGFESGSHPPFSHGPPDRDAAHKSFESYPPGGGGRFLARGFGRGRGRFDRGGRVHMHHRQGPPDGGRGGWNNTRVFENTGDREERNSSYASLALDGPNPVLVSKERQPEPVQPTVHIQLAAPVQPPTVQEPEIPKEPDVVPPSPPPEPAEPSAFTVAVTRMVDLESQLDFAIAKHLQLMRQSEILKVQVFTLRDLPVGREAFQDDLDALIAAHEKIKMDAEDRKRQEEEMIRMEAEEAKKLGDAALRGRFASEDTTDEGLIEE